ncbi:hypothetical protein EK21DRAFT_100033 [Setomelanomma holmii]|uniref:DUF3824 domain-containing protein n=1 Tax=Setomelanomma holmii TaxID=210430 RepID=A0A9P4HAI8_9PLEO|nr:hypothetical protein EK21DRAFT_100033 [Setomelanomma holmii]
MSVIYKEREREREWDTTSRNGPQSYTTVRRYKVPDHSLEQDTYESEMKLVHRGGRNEFDDRRSVRDFDERRSVVDDRRSFIDDRRSTKDYVVEDREVREYRYNDRAPSPLPTPPGWESRDRDVREYRIERKVERSPSPHRDTREIRIQREYERDLQPQREDQYSLEKYSRDIEYFREPERQQSQPQSIYIRNEAPPPQQPVIIREREPVIIREREEVVQPIIIRERAPEPAYELIERSEVQQERQVARPREEQDYYYERRVKEVDRGGRHEERYVDERERGRDRFGDRNYYSDDDAVYIHKEKDTWGSETHAKRDVAAGALAGIAAGQIVRHHRKRKGEEPGGNIGNALGYGALGAASAVALDKFNNRDRSRSVSPDRGRGRRGSHGRGRSKSRVRELGALAAIAGVGALAYAAGRKNKDKGTTTVVEEHRHRSRSRRSKSRRGSSRRGRSRSVTVIETDGGRSRSRSSSKHLDPKHRNNKTAQVGLASAAVAGLVQHRRSKSRKREGRSRSRIREGVPVAAAGVTGAAITGLRRPLLALLVWQLTRLPNAEIARRRRRSARNDYTELSSGEEDSAYSTGSYSPYDSPRTSTAHPGDSRFFPETNYFPPPPTAPVDHNAPYPPYNPADYPPPPSTIYEPGHPSGFVHPPQEDLNPGNPYAHPPPQQHDAYYGQPRRPDDNVSASAPVASGNEHVFASARDRVSEPESPSPLQLRERTVQFDLNPRGPSREPSPEKDKDKRDESEDSDEGEHRRHRRRRKDDERSDSTRESGRQRKRHHRDDDAGNDSDATIDLPPRFDEHGRRGPDDPMADKLESVLQTLFRR